MISASLRSFSRFGSTSRYLGTTGYVPDKILVDIIDSGASSEVCTVNEAQDLGALLRTHKKAVIFAVPGAFTPTCSVQHLPGFITHAKEIRAKGVDAIYCLSVNDRFVMKAWADTTPGCKESGIKLVADGNGDYTAAFGQNFDLKKARLGVRSHRYAAIVEHGKVTALNVDNGALEKSSAEAVLKAL